MRLGRSGHRRGRRWSGNSWCGCGRSNGRSGRHLRFWRSGHRRGRRRSGNSWCGCGRSNGRSRWRLRLGRSGHWCGRRGSRCGGICTINTNQATGSAICGELLSVFHNGELCGHLLLNAKRGVWLSRDGEKNLLGLGVNFLRLGGNSVGESKKLNMGFSFKLRLLF